MFKYAVICIGLIATLTACGERVKVSDGGAKTQQRAGAYIITPDQVDAVQFRMEDSINSYRQATGALPVRLNPELIASAATHSRDMYIQNRPWLFGSDGSSPLERAQRAGFTGKLFGEVISETFEDELQTLTAWMQNEDTRAVILDKRARLIGFAWFQEPSGKIWWTLSVGSDVGRIVTLTPQITPLGKPVEGSIFQSEE